MDCRVIFYDSSLADLQSGSHTGTVMGIYHKCFHLLLDDGRLITVFGGYEQQMPMSLRTDVPGEEPFALIPLEAGQRAACDRGVLTIPQAGFTCWFGGTEVCLKRVPLPKPKCTGQFQNALLRWRKPNGQGKWVKIWCMYLARKISLPPEAKLLCQMEKLLKAVDTDTGAVWQALMHTVGMGIGLTPSADDMISGLAAAAWLYWPEKEKQLFLETLSRFCREQGQNRTTLVSCQQLRLTAQGILSDPVFYLAEAISLGNEERVDPLTEAMVRYGSSSGTEWCMGFLAGLYMAAGYSESERENQW